MVAGGQALEVNAPWCNQPAKALVQEYARAHPTFAARLSAASTLLVPAPVVGEPPEDRELLALKQTRQFLFLRTMFLAWGILFALLPLTFTVDEAGFRFLIWGRHEGLVWSFWGLAAASWTGWYVMHRQVRHVGL